MRVFRRDALCSFGRLNGTSHLAALPTALSLLSIGKSCVGAGAWCKLDLVPPSTETLFGLNTPSIGAPLVALDLSGNQINYYGGPAAATVTTSLSNANFLEGWMHLYVECDFAQNKHRLYVNGVLASDATVAFSQTTVATGAGGGGNIGATRGGTSFFTGFVREFCHSLRRLTAQEVSDIYAMGLYPRDMYVWPCDDGQGATIACYQGDVRVSALDATPNTAGLFSREVPYFLNVLDRNAGYCARLDGANDSINIAASGPLAFMTGKRYLTMGVWMKLDAYPATKCGVFFPDGGGSSGFSVGVTAAGQVEILSRSTTGGFVGTLTSARVERPINLRLWNHIVGVLDYTGDTIEAYVNGVLVGRATGVAWENTTCQLTTTGNLRIGNNSNYLTGYVDDFFLGHGAVTPGDIRAWFISGLTPPTLTPIVDMRFNEGVGTAPQDTSGNALHGVFSGIATPYGYFPNSYMS